MRNIYYEFFYLLSSFVKWTNRRNKVYTFSGMGLLTILMIFNLYSILTLLKIKLTTAGKNQLPYVFVSLTLIAINYFFLNYKGKDVLILDEYNRIYKQRKQNKAMIPALVVYALISLAAAGYIAYLKRNHFL